MIICVKLESPQGRTKSTQRRKCLKMTIKKTFLKYKKQNLVVLADER